MSMENKLKPTGEKPNDGIIQLSFSIEAAAETAVNGLIGDLCRKMNLYAPEIASVKKVGSTFYHVILFAKCDFYIENPFINRQSEAQIFPNWSIEEVEQQAKTHIKRKLNVIGACTGSDAHTVGIDAIFNAKGYKGNKGLEKFKCFRAYNLGSQVSNHELLKTIVSKKADVVLISQIITHNDIHLRNLTEFLDILEAENLRHKLILVIGGPRINNQLAVELGFDAGFGSGTIPVQVASFIVSKYLLNAGL